MKILVFDPGESTGWVLGTPKELITGGTAGKNHLEVAQLITDHSPDVVVLERFNLYPGMAQHLAWNSFYPCEVIGVIKYVCMCNNIPWVEQAPGIKKYSGGLQEDWVELRRRVKTTVHTQDAYAHYRYFLLNGLKKFQSH